MWSDNVIRRITKLCQYSEPDLGIYALGTLPLSVIDMGPAYRTEKGQLDRLLCAKTGSETVLTIWIVGTIDSHWFTNNEGEVQRMGSLTIKVLELHDQGLTNGLLKKFTKSSDNGESLLYPTFTSLITLAKVTPLNNAQPGYAKLYFFQNADPDTNEVHPI